MCCPIFSCCRGVDINTMSSPVTRETPVYDAVEIVRTESAKSADEVSQPAEVGGSAVAAPAFSTYTAGVVSASMSPAISSRADRVVVVPGAVLPTIRKAILVADDTLSMRMTINRLFSVGRWSENHNIEIIYVQDGINAELALRGLDAFESISYESEARKVIEAGCYQFVAAVLDNEMPCQTGVETARKLGGKRFAIPLFGFSSSPLVGPEAEPFQATYLKPARRGQLKEALEKLLAQTESAE